MKPRPITEREQALIDLYGYCQLGMTPQQFYAKWLVNHETMAFICSRSMSTVDSWFRRGRHYRLKSANEARFAVSKIDPTMSSFIASGAKIRFNTRQRKAMIVAPTCTNSSATWVWM